MAGYIDKAQVLARGVNVPLFGKMVAMVAVSEIEKLQVVNSFDEKWISVDKLWPPSGEDVIVAFDDGEVCAVWQDWIDQEKDDFPLRYYKDFMEETYHTVTHWMPLPKPPRRGK